MPLWADQLLPHLFMAQFDTLPIQCRHIEHINEGVLFRKNNFWRNDSCENLDNFPLLGFCICIDGAIMCRSTPTTAFDGTIWYFADTMLTHWTYAWRSLVHKKIVLTKWQLWELRQLFPYMAFVYALIVPYGPINSYHSFWWSNMILCQYNVDTEHMHEGVYNFCWT